MSVFVFVLFLLPGASGCALGSLVLAGPGAAVVVFKDF